MAILCGWAAIDERGRASGGQSGDQRQITTPDYYGEARVGNWYAFGQTEVFRWKDRSKAKKYAAAVKALCNNKNVGYDQGGRNTLYNILKANGWDYTKVNTPCETDCSALAGAAINCVTKSAMIPSWIWTGNIKDLLIGTGLFTRLTDSKYLTGDSYLMEGDIINNPARHVIIALGNGSKATGTTSSTTKKLSLAAVAKEVVAGKWGVEPARSAALKKAGYDPAKVQAKVNELLGQKKAPLKTARVVAKAGLNVRNKPNVNTGKILRTLPYNSKVTCYGVATGSGAKSWWKIHSSKAEYVSADWLK